MSTATDPIPDGWEETMDDNDWGDGEREAFRVIHNARPGDMVLFADRSVAMEVAERGQDEEGRHYLEVEKPRADGTYTVRERYHNGSPKYTSDVGRANDLHWVERQPEPRGLDEGEYESLVQRQSENAQDAFLRLDYNDWSDAVTDVVETWSEEVAFQRWRGYKHHSDWEDDDVEAIFESVLEHSDYEGYDDGDSLRTKAETTLYNDVFHHGREEAERSIIQSESDYDDIVEMLAHHSLDRYDRKSYDNARVAVRDTVSQWIDDRGDPAYQSVIEYGEDRFPDSDYDDLHPDEVPREKAFDILDHEVWELAQVYQRDRGEHDPTLRGLTYTNYRDLVEVLGQQTARHYDGRGFVRTAAKDVVEGWADAVEMREWGGHRHRVYAEGDVEDIFASVAIHAEADPIVWNPFSSNKERKMAVQAITPEVVDHAENIIDEHQADSVPTPADDYIEDTLGLDDVTYDDFASAHPEDVEETVNSIMSSVDGSEVGWTFVDEIIEHGGVVPEATNDWLLVDYGVIREGETLRKLAWFNRETGDVLVISGMANAQPDQLDDVEQPYDSFHVTHHRYDAEDPEFLLSDVSLEDALNYVYDRLDADRADFRVIETRDDVYIQDQITDEDINAGGALDALIPNVPFGTEDLMTLAGAKSRRLGNEIQYWGPELAKITAYGVLAWVPKWAGDRLDGVRVEPNMHKRHGVGVNISKEFGSGTHESGVGGEADVELMVRPQTFSKLSDRYAPRFMEYGFNEGDIGKGLFRDATERVEDIQHPDTYGQRWGKEFLDTFGGSVTSFLFTLRSGQRDWESELMEQRNMSRDELRDELRSEFVADYYDVLDDHEFVDDPEDLIDSEEDWDDLPEEIQRDYGEYIEGRVREISTDDMKWDDLRDEELGISGMLMRGLDAEALVSGAEFFDIDDWLDDRFSYTYRADEDAPSFEEWENERFGPGQPGGPEEEARRRARYHKEVAAGSDTPDPYDTLGVNQEDRERIERQIDEDDPDDLGDYNYWGVPHFVEDGFDRVADRFAGNERPGR